MSRLLSQVHPELVSEWSERNLPLTPDEITYGSNKVVWWKGTCGHEWKTSVKARSKGENCPICSGARVIEGINDLASMKADKVVYTSQEYTRGCMHKRNRHLVDNSSACISYLTENKGGTFYTVNYAKSKGVEVINIAE